MASASHLDELVTASRTSARVCAGLGPDARINALRAVRESLLRARETICVANRLDKKAAAEVRERSVSSRKFMPAARRMWCMA